MFSESASQPRVLSVPDSHLIATSNYLFWPIEPFEPPIFEAVVEAEASQKVHGERPRDAVRSDTSIVAKHPCVYLLWLDELRVEHSSRCSVSFLELFLDGFKVCFRVLQEHAVNSLELLRHCSWQSQTDKQLCKDNLRADFFRHLMNLLAQPLFRSTSSSQNCINLSSLHP